MHLAPRTWHLLRKTHTTILTPLLQPHLTRAARGETHPVLDFMFRYYSFRPHQLLRWSPGFGTVLSEASDADFPDALGFRDDAGGRSLDPTRFPSKRLLFLRWLIRFNDEILARPPRFSCFGLHEWAMLYRTTEARHSSIPLRVSPEQVSALVEHHPLGCTHFDAFRFFTPDAIPLNATPLTRETTLETEQSGCLHANMDLYKWCYKLSPWVGSDILRDAFLLAWEARTLDMEASPYDLSALGYGTVAIETDEGKSAYIERQRAIQERAQPIRARLSSALKSLLAAVQ